MRITGGVVILLDRVRKLRGVAILACAFAVFLSCMATASLIELFIEFNTFVMVSFLYPNVGFFLVSFDLGLKNLLMWSFAGPGAAAFLDSFIYFLTMNKTD